jgi:NADH-quinone oxidoreductase subunit L
MLVPLVVLAVLSVAGGWVAAPALFGGTDRFAAFLGPLMGNATPAESARPGDNSRELTLAAMAVGAALTGFLVAWWFYLRRKDVPDRLSRSFRGAYTLLVNKYYVDEIYDAAIVRPLVWLSTRVLWNVVDEGTIDGSVNGVARGTQAIGERVRRVQSGNTRSYAAWVVVGAVLVIGLLLWPLLKPALGMVH